MRERAGTGVLRNAANAPTIRSASSGEIRRSRRSRTRPVRAAVPLVREKIGLLAEFPGFAGFLFGEVEPDPALLDARILAGAERALTAVEPWDVAEIEVALKRLCDELGEKPRTVYLPIRVAVTGSRVSPGLYESLELLGRDVSLARHPKNGYRWSDAAGFSDADWNRAVELYRQLYLGKYSRFNAAYTPAFFWRWCGPVAERLVAERERDFLDEQVPAQPLAPAAR